MFLDINRSRLRFFELWKNGTLNIFEPLGTDMIRHIFNNKMIGMYGKDCLVVCE